MVSSSQTLEMSESVGEVWRVLDTLTDPEIPVVTLREMGIVRGVELEPNNTVVVVITPTYSGCPAMEQIHDDICTAVKGLGFQVRVRTQLAPAWTTDWMSDIAKEKLRAYGIAAPNRMCSGSSHDVNIIQFMRRSPNAESAVECPRCSSENTVETSHFGSTACKALYKCLDCQEPFDYFKPY